MSGIVVGSVGERVAQLTQNKQTPISRSSLGGKEYKLISAKNTASSKWITPTKSQCRGGEMYKGVCGSNWKNAKNICSALGGRLPTIDELRAEVTKCGGEIKDDSFAEYQRNRDNKSYQSCYKKNGFLYEYYYWSSNTNASYSSNAWVVFFYDGDDFLNGKDFSYLVRCVRDGQWFDF